MNISVYNFQTTIFPLGLFLPALLIAVFVVGLVLAMVYRVYRKPIGAGLSVIGILEILPFVLLSLGLNDVMHFLPFMFLQIVFLLGCITLVGGVVIFYLPKSSRRKQP
jgi:hypothetical protein